MRRLPKIVRDAMGQVGLSQAELTRRVQTTKSGKAYPKSNMSRFLKGEAGYDTVPYEVAEQIAVALGSDHERAILEAWCADRLPSRVWEELQLLRKTRVGRHATAEIDPELMESLDALLEVAPQDEVAAVLTQMVEVGWKRLLPFLNDLLHRLMQLRVVVEGRENGAAEKV